MMTRRSLIHKEVALAKNAFARRDYRPAKTLNKGDKVIIFNGGRQCYTQSRDV